MGAYDGEEVCDLAGIFLLYAVSLYYNKTNISLYGDYRLAIFRILGACIVRNFKPFFIKCNLKIVDFFDATLNLTDSTY